jgi:hypothetical protein
MSPLADLLAQVLPGAVAGAALAWLLRGWISERLKQSISHEYSAKLENHKSELELRVQALRHDYEVNRLRTSLFFDHQRAAFAELLAKIAEVNQEWWRTGYEDDIGLVKPVPNTPLRQLRNLYYEHQLFLDTDSVMAMELLFEVYQDSLPFDDGSGSGPKSGDVREPYDTAEYLQPRIAALFQQKIGVASDQRPVRQMALLGAIRILNRYHFRAIGLPVGGALKLESPDRAAEGVMRAERNFDELVKAMRRFYSYLQTETTFFHEAEASLGRYLTVLAPPPSSKDG